MIPVCRKNPGIRGNLELQIYLKYALLLFKELSSLQSVHSCPGRDIHANIDFQVLGLALQSDLQLSLSLNPCLSFSPRISLCLSLLGSMYLWRASSCITSTVTSSLTLQSGSLSDQTRRESSRYGEARRAAVKC